MNIEVDTPVTTVETVDGFSEAVASDGSQVVLLPTGGHLQPVDGETVWVGDDRLNRRQVEVLVEYLRRWLRTGHLFGVTEETLPQPRGVVDFIRGLRNSPPKHHGLDDRRDSLPWFDACDLIAELVEDAGRGNST